jgi:hypothetical protein
MTKNSKSQATERSALRVPAHTATSETMSLGIRSICRSGRGMRGNKLLCFARLFRQHLHCVSVGALLYSVNAYQRLIRVGSCCGR